MRITPLDVRKQEFRRSVRGFDCDEVRAFMATLADEYEIVLVDNKQIREKVMLQEEKITEYKSMERTLRDTLMTAEKLMQETRENANKESDLIIRDAKLKATQILQECRLRTEELRREIEGLRKEKENYLGRFKSLAESQIQFIESHRTDFKDLDDRLTGIVDSVVAGVATSAADAEKEAVVDTIVEAMIQPESEISSEHSNPTEMREPARGPEVDIWRNYNPAKSAGDQGPEAEDSQQPDRAAEAENWNSDQENRQDQIQDQGPENSQDQVEHGSSEPESGLDGDHSENEESNHVENVTEALNI
jgi:cell division initiation protein